MCIYVVRGSPEHTGSVRTIPLRICKMLAREEKWGQVKATRNEKGLWYRDEIFPDDTDDAPCSLINAT